MNILNHESIASEWLTGLDLAGRNVTVTIRSVSEVEVPEPRTGRPMTRVAVEFAGARKRLLLNATNAKSLAKLFGVETDQWSGCVVVLRPETITAFGAQHCVVRIAGAAPMKLAESA